jgi:hypothetical protein
MTTADEALDDIPFAYPAISISFTTPIGRQPPTRQEYMKPGCIGKSNTNNLPAPNTGSTNLIENPCEKINFF